MLLLVDGNNVAWAGFHALRRPMGADTPEKYVRAALLGLTQSAIGFAIRAGEPPDAGPPRRGGQAGLFDTDGVQTTRLVIAFDEGRPLRRRSVFPAYQTGRESDPSFMEYEKYVLEGILQFSELAAYLPVSILRGTNTEADDLIAAEALTHAGPVRICSTDRDFLQLVDERISIYSPVKRLVVTTDNFAEATAPKSADGSASPFPRERYLDYRAASGDASDNLPGIPGVGALTAAKLVAAAPLDAYLHQPAQVTRVLGRKNARIDAAFASGEAAEAVTRNRALMDLRLAAKNYPSLDPYRTPGSWDESRFREWIKEQRIAALEVESAVECLARIAAGAHPAG
jgi:5'-3' exonuclease